MRNNDFICRYKADDFALLLTCLQKIEWLPVYRLIVV